MATTKVTLQIEPFDVQLICDGLTLYRTMMAALEEGLTPLGIGDRLREVNLPLYNGDPGYCHGQANRLLAVMGLRTGAEREPQLRMWGDERVETETYTAPDEDTTEGKGDVVIADGTAADDGHLVAEVILETSDGLVTSDLE